MSEPSKDVRAPSSSAESSQVEVDGTPEVPRTLPPSASEAQTVSEPQNLPPRPQDDAPDTPQASSPQPQALGDEGAAKDRQEAEQGARRPARSGPCLPPSPSPPGPAQLVQKARELMWYVLVKEQRKAGIWFPDMVKEVIGSYKKWCRGILRRTSLLLARVFGLRLRLSSVHTMEFSLVRALQPEELDRVALGGRMPMAGLLLMILSLIYVKGRGARESAVWDVLRLLGLRPWKMHPTFGEVRKLVVEDFVQQNYLKYQRVLHVEPPEYEFFWGARASHEITKMQILEFLARVFKKDPRAWPSRYREALEQARALRAAAAAGHQPRSGISQDDEVGLASAVP